MNRSEAINLAKQAQHELNGGYYSRAISLVDSALAQDPDNALAHVVMARIYLVDNKFDEAEEVIDRTLKIIPDHSMALQIKAKIAYQRNKFEEADQLLTQSLTIKPDDRDGRMMKAILARKLGRPQEAEQHLEMILKAKPDHRKAMLLKGELAYERGDMEATDRIISNLLRYAPDSFEALWLKAFVADSAGDHEKAEGCIDKLLALKNIPVRYARLAHKGKAEYAFAIGDLKTAEEHIDLLRGKLEQPNDHRALYLKAVIAHRRHQTAEVENWMDILLKIKPDYISALNFKARLAIAKNDNKELGRLIKNLQQIVPHYRATVFFSAVYHLRAGDFLQAWNTAVQGAQGDYSYDLTNLMKEMIEHGVATDVKIAGYSQLLDAASQSADTDARQFQEMAEREIAADSRIMEYNRLLDAALARKKIDDGKWQRLQIDYKHIRFEPAALVVPDMMDDELGDETGRIDRSASAFRSRHFLRPINTQAFIVGNYDDCFREVRKKAETGRRANSSD